MSAAGILVVDDDPAVHGVLTDLFEGVGHHLATELAHRIILTSGEPDAPDQGAARFAIRSKPFGVDEMRRAVEAALAA